MPAISGSYQYTWSVASPVASNNSLAMARQVNFPPSFASQPQHCYLPNSVPQLPSQNFTHMPTSVPPATTEHRLTTTLSQPLYQNQCPNSSPVSGISEHQKVSPVHTTSLTSQTLISTTTSQPTSQHFTASSVTPVLQQIHTTTPSSSALQSSYTPKTMQHVLTASPLPVTLQNNSSPSVNMSSPTQLTLDKNNTTLSASQQIANQKSGATGQQTYLPM